MFKVNNTLEFISAPTIAKHWFARLIAVAYFERGARTYQKILRRPEYENGWEPFYYKIKRNKKRVPKMLKSEHLCLNI